MRSPRLIDGEKVRRLRYLAGPPKLTQAEVAARVRISKAYLSDIETGRRTGERHPLLAEWLAEALGVDVEEILLPVAAGQ